jgi:hypothetical protein
MRWLLSPELTFVADKLNEIRGAAGANVVSGEPLEEAHQAGTTGRPSLTA